MVQLVEVEDEHFQSNQTGPEEEDDFTDTGKHSCLFFLDGQVHAWDDALRVCLVVHAPLTCYGQADQM